MAWSITVAMLALAGVPGTVGFVGKFQLIHALINGGYGGSRSCSSSAQ